MTVERFPVADRYVWYVLLLAQSNMLKVGLDVGLAEGGLVSPSRVGSEDAGCLLG